ncbi:MAG: tetratricopeptide repeat protein, partial [Chthoniobacteraceae bacterium]
MAKESPSHFQRWQAVGISIFLVAAVFVVFSQTMWAAFVNYDDNLTVYDNPVVAKGLTLGSVGWAFTHSQIGHWDPLTTLSHMFDCQVFGLNAGGHHFGNVLLHAAAAVLLFLVLRSMTGFVWRSAFVATVFAVHPLRVESVAWVTERKDVLSGLFFMLTLWAYVRWVRGTPNYRRYLVMLLLLTLGLMSKSILVTLPFVLLLLDYWPLARWGSVSPARLVLEKVPLFALSVAMCVAQWLADKTNVVSVDLLPLWPRVGNAAVSYVIYLGQMLWPSKLAVFYPYFLTGFWSWQVVLSLLALALVSAGVFAVRKKVPGLLVGWLWYAGMLVPVSGVIQSGEMSHADRYTYLPQIGLYLGVTWAVADWSRNLRHRREVLGGLMALILSALMVVACRQAYSWRDSESLWTHALECTSGNYIAHDHLANELIRKGHVDEAVSHYQEALSIKPGYAEALTNLGNAFLQQGHASDAIASYQKALQLEPGNAEAHNDFGNALYQKGRVVEAIEHYQAALELKPDYADAHCNLGMALLQEGSIDAAISHYKEAVRIKPDYANAQCNLGNALLQQGHDGEAVQHAEIALRLEPANITFQNNLAWMLATVADPSLRDGARAIELAQRANQSTGGANPGILHTLAAAYAAAGRFPDAVTTARLALGYAGSDPD